MGEKRTLAQFLWKCKLVQAVCKTVWKVSKKMKMELPCDPEILLLGIESKGMKSIC
jgi:hypothetical protein